MALLTITDNDAHMQHFLYRIAFGHEQPQTAKLPEYELLSFRSTELDLQF